MSLFTCVTAVLLAKLHYIHTLCAMVFLLENQLSI